MGEKKGRWIRKKDKVDGMRKERRWIRKKD